MKKKPEKQRFILRFLGTLLVFGMAMPYFTHISHGEVSDRPMIIWFHDIETGTEALRLALSSGIFSHVLLEGVSELDKPDYFVKPKFREALRVLHKYKNVKFIWCRWLYPGHKFDHFKLKDAFEVEYYTKTIRCLKQERKLLEADLIAFDAEPYVKCPLKTFPNRRISESQFNMMRNTIMAAVEAEGKVDFVLPAPFIFPGHLKHLYAATSEVGETVIAEHTYRDVPKMRNDKRRPYDVFGAYVSMSKEDLKNPKKPYFTPREILERQELWSHKRGLFIYPGNAENAISVALEFSKIKTIQRRK